MVWKSRTLEDQYLAEDGSWKDVEPTEDYTVVRNSPASRADTDAKGWSAVTFKPVTTKSLRLVLTPYTGSSTFGAAVAEWGVHGIDGTEPEPTPVDKTALKSALDTANGLDANRYTAASWAEFQQIIDAAQAVYDDANATAEQVAEQVTKLEDGQKALVALATDVEKSTLQAAIDTAKAEAASGKYTDKSVEALNKAIEAAEGVLKVGEVTQAAVQEASASLNKAVKALEEKPAAEEKTSTRIRPGHGAIVGQRAGDGSGRRLGIAAGRRRIRGIRRSVLRGAGGNGRGMARARGRARA